MLQLVCASTHYISDHGLSHILYQVTSTLGPDIRVCLIVPGCAPEIRDPRMIEAVPVTLAPIIYRSNRFVRTLTELRLLREMAHFDAAFLFPAISPAVVARVKRHGLPVVVERVNCAQQTAKKILDNAYRQIGQPPGHAITDRGIAEEREELENADYVMCPSPRVHDSFLELGVPAKKLISTSYGWAPSRFPNRAARRRAGDEFTVLFVGRICVRKGAHLLLAAWARAGIRGKLILCGDVESAVERVCRAELGRADVSVVPYTREIGLLYQNADLFAFPSLEEGGPLVTYEAMAHGLPVLTSPMGAGAIVRDNMDGRILEPYDKDAWIDALREFSGSEALRKKFTDTARARANEFTWDRVSAQRGAELVARLGGGA